MSMDKLLNTGHYNLEILSDLDQKSENYKKFSRSEATKSAYNSDLRKFTDWARKNDCAEIPATPTTIRRYITHMADIGRSTATISRTMTAIRQAHQLLGFASPTVHPDVTEVWRGIRRSTSATQRRAKALLLPDLKTIIDYMRPTFIGHRDSALLLIGWAGALRRSEIVALTREDCVYREEGLILTIRKSKTDQESLGYQIGIPWASQERYCPARRLQKWINLAQIESGPLFFAVGTSGKKFFCAIPEPRPLSDRMVNLILIRRAKRANLPITGYSGHSLRAGFITEAARVGTPESLIQLHTRHQSTHVMRSYIRQGSLFEDNPLATIL